MVYALQVDRVSMCTVVVCEIAAARTLATAIAERRAGLIGLVQESREG